MNAAALPLVAGGPPGWVLFGIITVATIGIGVIALSESIEDADSAAEELSDAENSTQACVGCGEEGCFKKPDNVSDEEFDRQLKEQEDAINNTKADDIVRRRDAIREAGGTDGVRDHAAQREARRNYETRRQTELMREGKTSRQARQQVEEELGSLAATHRLDIIAGGDPSDISGMGDRSVNSSLGSQWKGSRSQALEDIARDQQAKGRGQEKMDVKLKKC